MAWELQELSKGLLTTVILTIGGCVIGFSGGTALTLLWLVKRKKWILLISDILRGTPMLLQAILAKMLLGNIVPGLLLAILVFGINSMAYSSQIVLSAVNSKEVLTRFLSIDREKYGIIKDITDKSCYTGGYYLGQNEELETYERLSLESEFINNSLGGAISYIKIDENMREEELEKLIKYIYENIQYIKLIK